jgi:hypothetical protein
MASAASLQYLVSGNNQFGFISLGRPTAAEALKEARNLAENGYADVRISTPRGRLLLPDEFDELER